ncbi:MAG: hypothetical protein JRF61_17440 [Deltaproteobacteria bacterium]|nr:hypothetical protein [Deltaproteobacteria bacterium]
MVQPMMGHRDVTSTRRYAKLADEALIYALRDREGGEDLSPACPPGESDEENINENNLLMVEAAGIEPDGDEPNPPENKDSS